MREDNYKFQIEDVVDSADFQLKRIMDRQYSFGQNYYLVNNKWIPEWRLRPSFSKGDKVLITHGPYENKIGIFEKYSIDDTNYVLIYIDSILIRLFSDDITTLNMETRTQKTSQVIPSSIEVVKKTSFEGEYISIPKADFSLLMFHFKNNKMTLSDKLTEMFQRWQDS